MSKLTEQAIKASFLKLLEERPLSRITVRDITNKCGINRNSFYYHYHDIPKLMEEILKDEADKLVRTYTEISSLDECVETAFRFILNNRRSIRHIYHSVDREVFERCLMQICEYTVNSWYDSVCGGAEDPGESQMQLLRYIRYELFGACIDFMNEGMPLEAMEDAKQLLRLSLGLLNGLPDGGDSENHNLMNDS